MKTKILGTGCGILLFLSLFLLTFGLIWGTRGVTAAENAFQEVPFRANFYFDNQDYQGEEGRERMRQSALDNLVRIYAKTNGDVKQNTFTLSEGQKNMGLRNVGSTVYSSKVELKILQNISGSGSLIGKDDQNQDVYLSNDSYSCVKTHANAKYSPQKGAKIGLGWLIVSMRPYYEGRYGDWSDVCVKQSVFGDRNGISGSNLTFEADGEYCVQLYFEAIDPGLLGIAARTYNVKLEYHFSIFNDHVDVRMQNTAYGVERNSVTNQPFRIEKTQTRYAGTYYNAYQDVTYTRYSLGGEYRSQGTAYNAYASEYFTEDGYYIFRYSLGGCFSRSFTITLDRTDLSDRLQCYNIYRQEGNTKYAERYFELAWKDLYQYGEKLRANIYRDGTLIEHARTDGGTKRYEGAGLYRIVISNVTNTTGDRSSKTLEFYVRVEADADPCENYNRLNQRTNLTFNRLQSKWLQVENPAYNPASGSEIYRHRYVCFPVGAARQANDFANTVGSGVKTRYYTPGLTGDFFFVDDQSIAVEAPVTQDLYLYDTFKFLHGKQNSEGGYIESAYGSFEDVDSGKTYALQYGVPISAYFNADGKYRVTEYDMYGNAGIYFAARDLTAPVVRIADEQGDVYTAVSGESYRVGEFKVSDFYDAHDDWAVLRINGAYYLKDEILERSFQTSGMYSVEAYDRSDNIISFTVEVNERDLSLNLLTHNDTVAAQDGGAYALLWYRCVPVDDGIFRYCDFTVDGRQVGYEEFCAPVTAFGEYKLHVADRYNGTEFTVTVTIAPREINAYLQSERGAESVRQGGTYVAKQFQIVLPEDYYDLTVNGKAYRGEMEALALPGAYHVTVTDRYSLQQIKFEVFIADREKSFYFLENNQTFVAAEDGISETAYAFSLGYTDADVLTNCEVRLNGTAFDAFGADVTEFGTYVFEIRDKFDGSTIGCTVTICPRAPKSDLKYDFDDTLPAEDGREYTVRRFQVTGVPEYCSIAVNGTPAADGYITARGTYEICVADLYRGERQRYVVRIGDLVTIEGAQNAVRTQADVKLHYDVNTVKITLRIDGKLRSDYDPRTQSGGYACLSFEDLQSTAHIYVIAENVFDASDREEIFLILEKPVSPSQGQTDGGVQTSGAVMRNAESNGNTAVIWTGLAVCLAGIAGAGAAYFYRRKYNG